jgi:hypothetical protein
MLDELGGFDEQFRLYGEDIELCYRAAKAAGSGGMCRRRWSLTDAPRDRPRSCSPATRSGTGAGSCDSCGSTRSVCVRLDAIGSRRLRPSGLRIRIRHGRRALRSPRTASSGPTGLARRDWRWQVGGSSGCFARPGAGLRGLLAYDERGVVQYLQLEDVDDRTTSDWDGSNFVVVSTTRNAIAWIALRKPSKLDGTGPGDAWHINSLTTTKGRHLLAAAFGDFTRHRGGSTGPSRTRVRLRCRDGQAIVCGRTAHHPRLLDGRWVVCNSRDHGSSSSSQRVQSGSAWSCADGHAGSPLPIATSSWAKARPATGPQRRASGSLGNPATSLAGGRPDRSAVPRDLRSPARARSVGGGVRIAFATNPLRLAEQAQRDTSLPAQASSPQGSGRAASRFRSRPAGSRSPGSCPKCSRAERCSGRNAP